ncbi:MAG TPA: TlpA disulfide reductase family protein [Burkholderiaceae bacterium]|nr:TlpA disulfide reductase family protein [Burkholderiaceae bacterium]
MSEGKRVALILLAVSVVAAAAGATVAWWRAAPAETAGPPASAAALFALTLPDADGRAQALAQWRGNVLVVNFWATWCAPCVEEMPDLNRVRQAYAARGVEVIGLALDQPDKVREFRDQHGLALPLLVAGMAGSDIARQLGNPAGILPYTVLVSPTGEVTQRRLGQIRPAELRRWLDAQLQARRASPTA